jgi:hypothetical protein
MTAHTGLALDIGGTFIDPALSLPYRLLFSKLPMTHTAGAGGRRVEQVVPARLKARRRNRETANRHVETSLDRHARIGTKAGVMPSPCR